MISGKMLAIPASCVPCDPHADRVAILLNELSWRTALTRERRDLGHWVPLHTAWLRRLLGRSYTTVLQEAEDAGFIERNHVYSAGRFSKSYRLGREHRHGRMQSYQLRRKRRQQTSIRLASGDTVGNWMASKFPQFHLDADVSGENPWVQYAAKRLINGEHFATRCEYGRFHSAFTSLKKDFRQQITFNGERLVEIDVKNCQPLMLGLAAQKSTTYGNSSTSLVPRVVTSPFTRPCSPSLFLGLCVDGLLYEHLLDVARSSGFSSMDFVQPRFRHRVVDVPLERKHVKQGFIELLFAPHHQSRRNPLWPIFQRDFPYVAVYMESVKREKYQALAHACQRLESKTLIDGAVREVMLRKPTVPLFTVHDSINTTAENVDLALDCLRSAFKPFGVTPEFSVSNPQAALSVMTHKTGIVATTEETKPTQGVYQS